MNLFKWLLAGRRSLPQSDTNAAGQAQAAVDGKAGRLAGLPVRQPCPVCKAEWQCIAPLADEARISCCNTCGSRWTAPATAAGWCPTLRMVVFSRDLPPGSTGPREVCEVLSDGVDGLLKIEHAAEKQRLGDVLGKPHHRLVAGGENADGTRWDSWKVFGAWEAENLRLIALYDLPVQAYYYARLFRDGVEDVEIRDAEHRRRVELVKMLEELRQTMQPPEKPAGTEEG